MTLLLDHLAVSAQSRDEARAHVEEALGLPMQTGGQHAHFGTHNHLMGLDEGLYLEAIAIDPEAPKPGHARWFNLDQFSGPAQLTNWICACDDLAGHLEAWPEMGQPVSLARGDLRWHMAVPEQGLLPFGGFAPALITWHGTLHPARMLEPTGAALEMLTIHHPQADALQARLETLGSLSAPCSLRFETGPAAFSAEFRTPHGIRLLT